MATTPTQRPVPSEMPQDTKFNAGKIDEFVTSMAQQYIDRLGSKHYTIEGLKQLVLQQIYNLGWNPVGTFQGGVTVDNPGDIVQDTTDDTWYRWDDLATLPKTVDADSTPGSTGGTGEGKWQPVDVSDVLRKDLASPMMGRGDHLVAHGDETVHDVLSRIDGSIRVDANSTPILSNIKPATVSDFGIVQTGQSLAEGGVGYDQSLLNQSVLNVNSYTLAGGPIGIATATIGSKITGLRERIRSTIGVTLTDGILTSGLAKKIYFHGQAYGGMAYADIKKGGSTGVYEKCITQATNLKSRVPTLKYKSVTIIHGEQDGVDNNTNYSTNLGEWISNFNADLKAVTGQSDAIHGYLCQTATAGGYGNNGGISQANFPTPLQQLIAHKGNSALTMVCSKYHFKYYDHAHITNKSQALLGEYYAKAMTREIISGIKFEPCRPVSFTKIGNKIVIKFTGVEDGLTIDTSNVSSIANNGFAYSDSAGNSITSVLVTAKDEVTITLSGVIGASPVIAYAYHNGAGGAVNQAAGLGDRGNLRGTSVDVSKATGEKLHPWCVIFKESI